MRVAQLMLVGHGQTTGPHGVQHDTHAQQMIQRDCQMQWTGRATHHGRVHHHHVSEHFVQRTIVVATDVAATDPSSYH